MIRAIRATLSAAVAVALLSGCAFTNKVVFRPRPPIPSYRPEAEGVPIRRIALLPLYYQQETSSALREMDAAFNAELSKTAMFEIVPISRTEMETMTSHRQISSTELIPGDLLSQLVARYGVDGVLFTDITHYFPYQPISIGARSKLVDARTGQIRRATDYLFDSGKPDIAVAARAYFLQNTQTNQPIRDDGNSILQSPSRFSRYVASETYRSLLSLPPPEKTKIVLNSPRKVPMF